MTADDLTAPLGREPKKRRRAINIPVPQIIAGVLAAFLGVFVLWAVVADDPFGGEPMAVVPANLQLAAKPSEVAAAPQPTVSPEASQPHAGSAAASASPAAGAPANTTTITIIDGKTGAKQEVLVPAPANGAAPARRRPARPEIRRDDAAGPDSENRRRRHAAGRRLRPAGPAVTRQARRSPHRADRRRPRHQRQRHRRRDRQAAGSGDARLRALRRRCRVAGRARPQRRSRNPAASADGAVRLSGQRSGPADAAHLAHAAAEHRAAALADEPVPRLCRSRQHDGRALHRLRAVVRADPARDRQART